MATLIVTLAFTMGSSSLAVFLAEGTTLHRAVHRANAVAALSVTRIGTQVSFPQRADADVFLVRHGLM